MLKKNYQLTLSKKINCIQESKNMFNKRLFFYLLFTFYYVILSASLASASNVKELEKKDSIQRRGSKVHFLKKQMISSRYYKRINIMNNACKIMKQFQKECVICYNENKEKKYNHKQATNESVKKCSFNTNQSNNSTAYQQYYTYWINNEELRKTLNLSNAASVSVSGNQQCLINLKIDSVKNNSLIQFNFVSRLLPIQDEYEQKMVYEMIIHSSSNKSLMHIINNSPTCLELGFNQSLGFKKIKGRAIISIN